MDDAEVQHLILAAEEHRARAARAREEAAARGPTWWGHHMLQQSAEYYDRRARDAERRLRRLRELGSASPSEDPPATPDAEA